MENENVKRRCCQVEYVVSSSLCPPAVRTLILQVHSQKNPPEVWRDVFPVLAIESRIIVIYRKYTYDPKEHSVWGATKEELVDRDYKPSERLVKTHVVYIADDGLHSDEDGDPGSNGQSMLVACPWPEEKDEEKLEPFFKELENGVKAICTRHVAKGPNNG